MINAKLLEYIYRQSNNRVPGILKTSVALDLPNDTIGANYRELAEMGVLNRPEGTGKSYTLAIKDLEEAKEVVRQHST